MNYVSLPQQAPGRIRSVPDEEEMPLENAVVAGPWPLRRSPTACRQAREAVRDVFLRWGLAEEVVCTAELLASELVSNALRHAYDPLCMTLERVPAVRCVISDGSPLPPRHHPVGPQDEHGRGLELVDRLAARWGCDPGPVGKSVWFELAADGCAPGKAA